MAGRERKDEIIECFKKAKEATHANLLTVGELGEHNGIAYYTSADFDGRSLRSLIQEKAVGGRKFALREAAQITIQILEGLQAAHDNGLTFRALRPEYVLVNVRQTGPKKANLVAQVRLVGLGFLDLVESGLLAEDEFTRGEAQYMAPELKSFEPIATARSDIYSVGVAFYEMLCGTPPVGTFQMPKQRRPDLPEHINDVIELALSNAPEDRYQSALDFANDVENALQSLDTGFAKQKPLLNPFVFIGGLLLVGLIGFIVLNSRTDPHEENVAKDLQIRSEVSEAHPRVTPGQAKDQYDKHPKYMIYVPAGPYVAGRLHVETKVRGSETLAERVQVAGFMIDAFEFPNKPKEVPNYRSTYQSAQESCETAGKRLCTAQEWEKACKGPKNYIYSYGDTFDQDFCGEGMESLYPSGARGFCRTEWGAYDMSGNFAEWTSTVPSSGSNRRIVKGGMRNNPEKGTRCAFQTDQSEAYADNLLSFRCCRDLNAPPVAPPPPPEPSDDEDSEGEEGEEGEEG